MKKLAYILFISFCSITVHSQISREISQPNATVPLIAEEITTVGKPDTLDITFERNFFHLDIGDGLCSRSIRKIFIDSRDNLWIATNGGGISIYNGTAFKNLSMLDGLPSDIVWDFSEAEDGRMWIATDAGVCIYDGQDFEYITEEDGLPSPYCWSLLRDSKDRMFIGTARGGFSIWDKGELTTHHDILGDTAVAVRNIYEDHLGKIWLCTWQGAITWDGESFENRFIPNRSRYARVVLDIDLSFYEEEGIIWMGTGDGLYQVSATDTLRYGTDTGLPSDAFMDLFVDSKKDIWIGSTKGLIKWNPNVPPIVITEKEGLPDIYVQTLIEDRWGNLWIGTQSRGIARYHGDRFTHINKKTGAPGTIWAVYEDDRKDVWIGMLEEGLIKYDGFYFLHYGKKQGFKWKEVVAIRQDLDGNFWFGTRGNGIIRFDGEKFYQYSKQHDVLHNSHVMEIEPRDDGIWLGTMSHMYCIFGDSIRQYDKEQTLIDHHIIMDMTSTKQGAIWAATFGGGASYLTADSVKIIKEVDGLPNDDVFSIAEDKFENTWFMTSAGGIAVLQNGWRSKPANQWKWLYFNSANGLASNEGSFVYADSRGDAWIGTALGLNRIELREQNVFDEDYTIHTYRESEGYVGIASKRNFMEDENGKIWFVSDDVLTIYDPMFDQKMDTPPVIAITDFKLKMNTVDWDEVGEAAQYDEIDAWTNLPSDLKLDFNYNHVMFEFLGVTYGSDRVEYRWKLEGFDADWNPWTNLHNATYAYLPPDDYKFLVEARDGYGNVSDVLEYEFTINKAYYHTFWFRAGIFIIVVLVIVILFRRRTMVLKKRQKVLEKTVEERTIEIQQQKEEIEYQQIEILDSIAYAKRIQEAILPRKEFLDEILPEAFIFYRPKDIVAGDFYWVEKVEDEIFIAAADCTGHGVPGAMVSVVCSNALNTAVLQEGILDPGKILDRVTQLVIERFKHGNEHVKDGMDIALCRWNKSTGVIEFAGAFNPFWKYSPDDQFEECEANKQPVGKFSFPKPFETSKTTVKKGDRFYLFSDGFADQFGGPRGKKFMTPNLNMLLASLKGMTPEEQKNRVVEVFDQWRGNYEQLDDVCLIGISV